MFQRYKHYITIVITPTINEATRINACLVDAAAPFVVFFPSLAGEDGVDFITMLGGLVGDLVVATGELGTSLRTGLTLGGEVGPVTGKRDGVEVGSTLGDCDRLVVGVEDGGCVITHVSFVFAKTRT